MGGGGAGDDGCSDGVLRISVSCVSWRGLLTVGLTSSAAMPPVCMHGTDVLTLLSSVTAVPLEAPADGDGVETMSSAGRTTAGSRDVVALGTLTQTT